jgi:nuclear transport factor 2 (NTF2) superfamily protein
MPSFGSPFNQTHFCYPEHGNENWEFDDAGLVRLRLTSIHDLSIIEPEREYHWPLGRRPDGHLGLNDLGF